MGGERELGVEGDLQDARVLSKEEGGEVEDDDGMTLGLVGVGGEERDCGFLGGKGESLPLSPLRNLGDVACEGRS